MTTSNGCGLERLNWQGETAVLVASGPSAAKVPLELARGRAKVIAINSSWRLVPWADILFACDSAWWFQAKGAIEFKGIRVTSSPVAMQRYKIDMFACVGNNSGLRAIYLAERLKPARILLVGYDMHMGNGVHWHDRHAGHLHNPGTGEARMWVTEMERIGPRFLAKGVKIVNCTPGSAIKCFPSADFEKALNDDGNERQDRADQPGYCVVPG